MQSEQPATNSHTNLKLLITQKILFFLLLIFLCYRLFFVRVILKFLISLDKTHAQFTTYQFIKDILNLTNHYIKFKFFRIHNKNFKSVATFTKELLRLMKMTFWHGYSMQQAVALAKSGSGSFQCHFFFFNVQRPA